MSFIYNPAVGGGGGATFSGGISGGNTSGNTGTVSNLLVLAGGNNITLSGSTNAGGMTATISAFNDPIQSNTLGMSNIGNTAGTTGVISSSGIQYLLAGGNNITLSQSINGASGTLTISAFNQSVQTQMTGLTAGISGGNTAGNSGLVSQQLVFAGGNNITLSGSTNGQSETITISAFNQSVQTQMTGLSAGMSNAGATSGTSGTVSNQIEFVGTNGIGLSQSVNAQSATLSIQHSPYFSNWMPVIGCPGPTSQGTIILNKNVYVAPVSVPWVLTATRANFMITVSLSTSSNSSHAGTLSQFFGIYTRNASTLSSASSASTSWAWTNTSNNSGASLSGLEVLSLSLNMNFTPGEYFFAYMQSSSTANANWITLSNIFYQEIPVGPQPFLSTAGNSYQVIPGAGIYSVSTLNLPASIGISELNQISNYRFPVMAFINVTA